MSLKAGRVGVAPDQVDPVNGKIIGDNLEYSEGVMDNEELTDEVKSETVEYTFVDNTITVNAGNTQVKKQGNVLSFALDFTLGANNISAWANILSLSEKPVARIPIMVVIVNMTDSQLSFSTGGISAQGVISIGNALLAGKRYAMTFTTIY